MLVFQNLERQAHLDGVEATVVGIVVPNGDAILLLKRRADDFLPNVWEIPGGHLDSGESIPEALRRELKEETGLDLVAIQRYLGHYDYDGEFGLTRQWNFEVQVGPYKHIVHPEHTASCWAAPADWACLPMSVEMRGALMAYAADR